MCHSSAELAHGSWTALMARSGTPAAVVQKLHAATQQCLQEPDVVQGYQGMHAVTLPGTRGDVADYIRRDTDVWKPLVARLGVRNDWSAAGAAGAGCWRGARARWAGVQAQCVAAAGPRRRGRSSLARMPATMKTAPSSAVAGRRSPAMRPMMPAQTGSVA